MNLEVLLVIIVVLLSVWWFRRIKVLPGPWSLPIVGYLPWIDPTAPYKTLHELAKRYGPIYSIYMGNIYTVVLCDAKMIKKVFSKDAATGRAPLFITHGLMKGCGLICAEGELWKNQRKFVHTFLRRVGGTKLSNRRNEMETLIWNHVKEFLELINSGGSPKTLIPSEYLTHSLGSFINTIVFGECWTKDDKTWKYLQHLQEEGIKYIGIAGPLNFIPVLRFLPKYRDNFRFLSEGLQNTHKIYDGIIDRHQKILDEKLIENDDYEPCNILEAFLLERKKVTSLDAKKFYSDQQLRYLLADIFGAGLDTTLTTINWFILFMCVHQDVQQKIRDEILTTVQHETPRLNDLASLPLFEATIAEVQRIRSTVPIGIPHGALADIEIDGYIIPKNSMIIPLQWAIHMDDNDWMHPENFNPFRFIDDRGKFHKPENLIPFQTGKRMCIGEDLAKMLLHIYCSSIIRDYEVSLVTETDVDLNGICGITLTPKTYEITFNKYKIK